MNRLVPVLLVVAFATAACSDNAVPVLELTTSTTTASTADSTTTSSSAPPTTEPATVTTTEAAAELFDPTTAQAEIEALMDALVELWRVDENTVFDPDDPRLEQIYTGEQLEIVREQFRDISESGHVVTGRFAIESFPPAILFETRQTAAMAACQFDGLQLETADGTVLFAAEPAPFDQFLDFAYESGRWKIASKGKPRGENQPCDL